MSAAAKLAQLALLCLPSYETVLGAAMLLLLAAAAAALYSVVGAIRHRAAVRAAAAEFGPAWNKLPLDLIWVVGSSGAGKSTLSERVAEAVGSKYVDLDDLYWLPGWQKRSGAEVRALLPPIFAQGPVVIAGSYDSDLATVMRNEASIVVWVRPALSVLLWQLVSRSLVRILLRRKTCGGNQESFYTNFFAPNSILRKTYKSYNRVELRYGALAANPPKRLDERVIQLRTRAQCDAFRQVLAARTAGTRGVAVAV